MNWERNVFCSTITRSYLREAAAFYGSLKQFNPKARYYVLLVDGQLREDQALQSFVEFPLTYIDELRSPAVQQMTVYYSAFELCNALRPWFVDFLIRQHDLTWAVHIDTDILVTGSFSALEDQIKGKSFAFCPHTENPFPEDGEKPDAETIRIFGQYNSGFMCFRSDEQGMVALHFLKDRLVTQCHNDIPRQFVDQTWLPVLVERYAEGFIPILHSGYNIAYWNLHERKLRRLGRAFFSNEKEAVFFHLSGYDGLSSQFFSKHSKRHRLDNAVLRAVARRYTNNLNSKSSIPLIPYRFEREARNV